jgi:hypothetical protein
VAARLCICGRSKAYPLCDGSHDADGWQCTARPGVHVPWCFVAGPHHTNVAERLASELGGVAAHAMGGRIHADRMVVLTDGTDLEVVFALVDGVNAGSRLAIALNLDAAMLRRALQDWPIASVQAEGLALWPAVLAAVQGKAEPGVARPLSPSFLSHAVADEALLEEPLIYLRDRYDADLFVCGDSIPAGTNWNDTILAELRRRKRFVMIVSRSSVESTFCAFETGCAVALGRTIHLISIDGSTPAAFIQHLHMVDLPRRRRSRPWMSKQEVLVDALLEALAAPVDGEAPQVRPAE